MGSGVTPFVPRLHGWGATDPGKGLEAASS